MKIITVAHQKGGVGKTTLTLNLADCFSQALRVGVVDTDAQGSLAGITDELVRMKYVPMPDKLAQLLRLPYDVLIIDTPPYLSNRLQELFAISDYVLLPSKVGLFDVMAIAATLGLIQQAQTKRPGLQHGVVLNMVKPRTRLNEDVKSMIRGYGANLLNTTIADRVSYTRSALTSGVFESDDDKAKAEITALADEILTQLGL